jgi:hypothetical protein
MIAGSARKIALGAVLAALSALLVPGAAAAAAPTVYCVIAYGHENPGNCDPHPEVAAPPYEGRIYPTSQPYGYGEKGLLFVEGNANPGARVTVTATDGTRSFSRTVEAASASDPQSGRRAGDFKADLKVTELGVHEGTPGNPNGISDIDITVVATVGSVDSAPATTDIDKYAIAPGDEGPNGLDKYKPIFPVIRRPQDSSNQPNPQYPPGFWMHLTSNGVGVIRGLVEDDHPAAYGHASEIASIDVTIKQGATLIRDFGNVANRVNSTQAKFDIVLNINNFEPSFPFSNPYVVTVVVKDANGNSVSSTGTFDVMPV